MVEKKEIEGILVFDNDISLTTEDILWKFSIKKEINIIV